MNLNFFNTLFISKDKLHEGALDELSVGSLSQIIRFPKKLRMDAEFIQKALIQTNGAIFKYLNPQQKDNTAFLLLGCSLNWTNIQRISEKSKTRDFFHTLLQLYAEPDKHIEQITKNFKMQLSEKEKTHLINEIDNLFFSQGNNIMEVISTQCSEFFNTIMSDPGICLPILKRQPNLYNYMSKEILENKQNLLEVFSTQAWCIDFIASPLKQDVQFMTEVVSSIARQQQINVSQSTDLNNREALFSLRTLGPDVKKDKVFILKYFSLAIDNINEINYVDQCLFNDRDFFLYVFSKENSFSTKRELNGVGFGELFSKIPTTLKEEILTKKYLNAQTPANASYDLTKAAPLFKQYYDFLLISEQRKSLADSIRLAQDKVQETKKMKI